MRKKVLCVLGLVLAVVCYSTGYASTYDFFGRFIPEGTPTIDGVIQPGEWDELGHITFYKFFGEDSKIEIWFMWDQNYLYLGAQVEDFELWIDNYNPSTFWESTWNDDAVKWEIDPNYSRHEFLQSDDRVLAINANGTARRFDQGNGSGGTAGVWVDPTTDGIKVAATINGTLNDFTFSKITSESQKDKGYTIEAAIRWVHIPGFASGIPSDGYSMGMNVTVIEDDTGGTMDPEYYKTWKRVLDELTGYFGEENHPENWAEFVISSRYDRTPPSPISNLKTTRVGPFSVNVSFTATGDNGNVGYAKSYDIRYATSPITESNWDNATVYSNVFRPQKSGKTESFKIIGLKPKTTYYFGIKAIDERGNASGIATTSATTIAASDATDKGFLTVAPGGRYFAWENGEPFIVIGDNQGISWPHIRSFYDGPMWNDDLGRYENFRLWDTGGIENGRAYLRELANRGVNTVRIIAENLKPKNPVYLYTDVSKGPDQISFNPDTLHFLETFLDECAAVGISVIVVPFDTFYYSDKFAGWGKVPLSKAKGGPMSKGEDFFEPANRNYIKAILKKLVDTIGNRKNLLAWDIVNEFDSDEPGIGWNRASFAKREETMNDLLQYMKSIDPNHMSYISSVRWDPKFLAHIPTTPTSPVTGNDAALLLSNPRADFNSTHMYYHDIRDPNLNNINNPDTTYRQEVKDRDITISPAARVKQGLQFYYSYAISPKPYLCTETGPIEFYVQKYDAFYTEENDNQIFHNMIWASLCSGDAGSGLRWPGEMLKDHKLTAKMRGYQQAMKNFLNAGNIDFLNFKPYQIGQYIEIAGASGPIVKTGITDGKQGMIFLVNDERKKVNGTISGATMTVPKLAKKGAFNFEFWDSYDINRTTPVQSMAISADSSGKAVVPLPALSKTQVIKFWCSDCPEEKPVTPTIGYFPADNVKNLWIRAVIHTEDKGPIEGVWKKGGEDTNSFGTFIWGYFYASPTDVSWGSPENPDIFVKIAIIGDWVNLNYFHVSVPEITVYTDYPYDGSPDAQDTATGPPPKFSSHRFIEHRFENGKWIKTRQYESGTPNPSDSPKGNPVGTKILPNLRIGAMINSVSEKDGKTIIPIEGIWKKGGEVTNQFGTTVWGYFYANPSQVSWGSPQNPDLFVKVLAGDTWAIVNYFHVSAPDIEPYCDFKPDGIYDNKGTASLSKRFIEFRY